jgi:hypothetical protein
MISRDEHHLAIGRQAGGSHAIAQRTTHGCGISHPQVSDAFDVSCAQ